MKAMVVKEANGDFVLEERPVPEPGPGEVRVKVEACGVCHSDAFVKFGAYPGLELPRVPGHEVAGQVEKLGEGTGQFAVGDRVGVGWHGGHCHKCDAWRRGCHFGHRPECPSHRKRHRRLVESGKDDARSRCPRTFQSERFQYALGQDGPWLAQWKRSRQ